MYIISECKPFYAPRLSTKVPVREWARATRGRAESDQSAAAPARCHEREKHLRAFRKTTGRTFTWYLTRRACIAKDTWRSRDCCRDRHVLHGGNQKKVASPQAATYARLNEARAAVSYRPNEAWTTVSCLSNKSWAAPSCRSKGAWATVSQKSSRQSCRSLQRAPPFCAA